MNSKAKKIVQTLVDNGHVTLFAGGCVRDMVLGLDPKDIDIATSATPDQVEAIFKRTIPVGKQFGVIVVLFEGEEFEVATFRNDGNYTDGRRPEGITFSSPEEDAKRRDLTINGMFFNPLTNEIIDFVGGKKDLENKTIRFIGNPQERIEEDRLRILRAIRFACKFRFDFDIDSLLAIERNAHRINDVSPERIKDELDKMLSIDKPSSAIMVLHNVGVLKHILPEVDCLWNCEQSPKWHSEGSVGIHTMMVLDEARKTTLDIPTLWAALLHDIGKPATSVIKENGNISNHGHEDIGAEMSSSILSRLKSSTDEKVMISSLIKDHMRVGFVKDMKKSTIRRLVAQSNFSRLMLLFKADCLGCIPVNEIQENEKLDGVKFLNDFISNPDNIKVLPVPFVSGKNLIDLGLKPGPLFKKILRDIMDLQLEDRITSKEEGLELVKEFLLIAEEQI